MFHSVGVIGYGGMGSGWHPQRMLDTGSAEVRAAYDISEEKRRKIAADGLVSCESARQLLEMPDIDIVVIATPNNFHREYALMALNAGKNVICEKPVMMNAAELREVLDLAESRNLVFSAHQNRRWDKDFVTVKSVIEEGTIGKPFYIESRVQGCRGLYGDWRCVKEAGGGILYDWGVHLIDQMLWLVKSPVVELYAQMLNLKFEADDNFKLLLKFENGCCALIEVDTYCFIPLPRWHVSGEHGTMVVDDWKCHGKIVKAKTLEMKWEEGVVWTAAGPTRTMAPRPREQLTELELPDIPTDVVDFTRNFIAAAEGRAEQIVKHSEMMRVMKVIDAAFECAKTGKSFKGVI